MDLIYGLPGETWESFRAGVDWTARLGADHLALFPLQVLDGSDLQEQAEAANLLDLGSAGGHFVLGSRTFPPAAVVRADRYSRVTATAYHWYRNSIVIWLRQDPCNSYLDLLDEVLEAVAEGVGPLAAMGSALRSRAPGLPGAALRRMLGVLEYEEAARELMFQELPGATATAAPFALAPGVRLLALPAEAIAYLDAEAPSPAGTTLVLRRARGRVEALTVDEPTAVVLRALESAAGGSMSGLDAALAPSAGIVDELVRHGIVQVTDHT